MTPKKKKTAFDLKKQLIAVANELLEFEHGKYDAEQTYFELDDNQTNALTDVIAQLGDIDTLLEDLGKRAKERLKELKDDKEDDNDAYESIFVNKSVLGLFRWLEKHFDDAVRLFDAIEKKTDARCKIDDLLKDVLDQVS